ncbi:hypothetical protein AQUCO_00300838v1 [Aquilegia coerulea]|uniref:Uncharacterized protein n=1 Tax=Aquilegia coerulea TaxID=218851 RepID=A0A2G5F0U0_AQUCA|nr:hypothetical protein AQUCO_00300838v1 [Aquilegia coerulea]
MVMSTSDKLPTEPVIRSSHEPSTWGIIVSDAIRVEELSEVECTAPSSETKDFVSTTESRISWHSCCDTHS